ncbi:flavin monoamine oxidase family protein [Candidatus Foliamicus sp.]
MKTRRREVLKGVLSLPALALPYPLRASGAPTAEKTSAIVIGGGLSGLYCALSLADFGVDVLLLEGSRRIGGRAFTADGVETRPEYGASEVGPSYARALYLCSRLNVKLIPDRRSLLPMSNYVHGTWVSSSDWPASDVNKMPESERRTPPLMVGTRFITELNPLENLTDWLSGNFNAYDVSVRELFRKNGVSAEALRLASKTMDILQSSSLALMQERKRTEFDASYAGTVAAEADSPFGLIGGQDEDESVPAVRTIEGGTSRLPEAIAAELGDRVRTQKVVAEIAMSKSGADVRCLDGSRYRADFVVSAVPFSTLRNISVTPRFEGAQAEAVFRLRNRGTTRAFGVVEEPYWEADGLEPSFFTDETIQTLAVVKKPGIDKHTFSVIFTGPSAARIDQLPNAEALALIESEIARIRPSTRGKLRFLSLYGWRNNRLVQGCRHMFAPGQITQFAQEMIVPHHRLHFAGEHARRVDFGMEAALESGERAAQEILARA